MEAAKAFFLEQCARYPKLRPQDLLKALHQSVFGCGHFITDEAAGFELLQKECKTPGPSVEIELLDGDYCRVPLGYLTHTGLSQETLFRLFALSAEEPAGSVESLQNRLDLLLQLADEQLLPFSRTEMADAITHWREAGYPLCRHSQEFRDTYHPTYRMIRKNFLWILPLLTSIDQTMRRKGRAVVAIEGGSASGKSTLSALLSRIYDCTVFHMDDFFLRPEQRTPQRFAEPGGNMDRERFLQEVLEPLSLGKAVKYQRYDCHSQTLQPPVHIVPKALTIVEGAYSMHPSLSSFYDLSAFLKISPELQRQRILKRNESEFAERFFSTWIPLESAYFEALDPANRCNLILEVPQ